MLGGAITQLLLIAHGRETALLTSWPCCRLVMEGGLRPCKAAWQAWRRISADGLAAKRLQEQPQPEDFNRSPSPSTTC